MYPPGTGPKLSVKNPHSLLPPYQDLTYKGIEGDYALPYGI